MNLAGTQPRVIWYAPQHIEGESAAAQTIFDLIPDRVEVDRLAAVPGGRCCVALWKGRRIGPLVAEQLPVVVRASETVEGRGRLYRSRRARDRAADALRTATLQRHAAAPRPRAQRRAGRRRPDGRAARGQRSGTQSAHWLFGPPPATDADLVDLAHALDDIERQVAHS